MCPTTSLHVSPRCYPIAANLGKVKGLNFCPFIIRQIKAALSLRGKKKSVNCYIHHLVVLYVDSLAVDMYVPTCQIRAEAWDSKLIGKVAQADRKPEGGFGQLKLKPTFSKSNAKGLFVGHEEAEKFVSSKLLATYNRIKKRKLSVLVTNICTEINNKIGDFIEEVGKLDRHDAGVSKRSSNKRSRRAPTTAGESEHDGGMDEDEVDSENSSAADGRHDTPSSGHTSCNTPRVCNSNHLQ